MTPIELTIKNFQSYSNTSLKFDFDSALILGQRDANPEISNGSGKSAIFASLAWCLYGKSKHKNANSVVKRGTDFCEVSLLFKEGDQIFKIVRKRNVKFSKSELSLFRVSDNGDEIPEQADTNRELDARVREILKMNYEVFLNSSYFQQNSISDFMDGTPSSKHQIVSSVLNLDRWAKYTDNAKKELTEATKLSDNITFKLEGTEDLEERLAATKLELSEAEKHAKVLYSALSVLDEETSKIEAKLTSLRESQSSLHDYQELSTKLDSRTERLLEIKSSIAQRENEIENLTRSISENQKAIKEIDIKVDEISKHLDIKDETDLPNLEINYVKGKTILLSLERDIGLWNGDEICVCCNRKWSEHKEKVAEINDKIGRKEAVSEKLSRLSLKIDGVREVLSKVSKSEIEIEKYTNRKKNISGNLEIHILKLDIVNKELISMKASEEEKELEIEELSNRIKGASEIAEANDYEELRTTLRNKLNSRESNLKLRNENIYLVGGLTQKVQELTTSKAGKDALLVQLQESNKMITVYSSLVKSFGRTGIQAIIIDNVIEELTREANEWLNKFCYEPTYVKFITQKKDSNGGWKETLEVDVVTPSGTCDFESLSGGEQFRVAFAIRLGLAQIQARRMGGSTSLLLLDEVSTSLDKHGLLMFISIIRLLEKRMKVMVVTHDDSLKEEFENTIMVTKVGKDSAIELI